ncbi:restriction endonuclease subunit S [Yimella sp. cx-573]|nr:restriction endonuclease subunit S [Yimella sp. cx-573]
MTDSVRIRELAEVNPSVPEFDAASDSTHVTFVPLEAVWPAGRLDLSRSRPKSEVATGYVRFREGDVLVPKVTPTFQAARSALAVNVPTGIGAASTEVHTVRVRPGNDPRYVMYGFHTEPFLAEGVTAFQGVAGLQRVPDLFLRNFRIRRRALDEQRRVADFLDDQVARIDEVIRLREEQLSLLGKRRRGTVDAAFAASESMKPTRIKNLLAARPRYGVLVPKYVDGGVPYIRVGDLPSLGTPGLDLPTITPGQSLEFSRTQIRGGEVLLGVVGKMGTAAVAPSSLAGANVARAVAVLSCLNAEDAPLLSAWFGSTHFMDQATLATSGDSVQPTLGMGDLAAFSVCWPRDPSQAVRKLGSTLERISALCNEVRCQIELLQERKRSLITAAVTGEFDVASASGRGVA